MEGMMLFNVDGKFQFKEELINKRKDRYCWGRTNIGEFGVIKSGDD